MSMILQGIAIQFAALTVACSILFASSLCLKLAGYRDDFVLNATSAMTAASGTVTAILYAMAVLL